MGIEFELKYRAQAEDLAAIAAAVTGTTQHYQMETIYYDTPDGKLSQRHCTLRCRKENDTSVCTLKMPAGDLGRAEFSLDCSSIWQAIPELCKLSGFAALAQLADEDLQEVCGARFHRTAITVQTEHCTLELALDQGVLTGGGKELPLCELEVELKDGSREAAIAYAHRLASQFHLQPERQSKFLRAFLLTGVSHHGRI